MLGTPTIPGLPDPAEVPAIFARHPELKPAANVFADDDRWPCGVCVLTALVADRRGVAEAIEVAEVGRGDGRGIIEALADRLGLEAATAGGVAGGWDSGAAGSPSSTDDPDPRYRDGYLWGVRAWYAVRAARGGR